MAMLATLEDELRCPITLQMLQDPVTCMACQQTFSRHAVQQQRACPLCRAAPLEMTPNRLAARLLATVREQADAQAGYAQHGDAQHLDGMRFEYNRPFTIFFTGMFGAGKSTLINLMVDPTGDTVVAPEGQSADGVTQTVHEAFLGNVEHRGSAISVTFVDTPGFGDPERSNIETLKQLCEATVQMAAGMDSIVHVVKMGRMQEADRQLPQLLLAGLAPDAETRTELVKRWVFVVTHCDSQRGACNPTDLERFKGRMESFFPAELHEAINRTIFVEHGRADSSYGHAAANRDQILDHVVNAREMYHSMFRCAPLQHMATQGLRNALNRWREVMPQELGSISAEEAASLLQFFKSVLRAGKFIEMSPATTSCEFRDDWNGLNLASVTRWLWKLLDP